MTKILRIWSFLLMAVMVPARLYAADPEPALDSALPLSAEIATPEENAADSPKGQTMSVEQRQALEQKRAERRQALEQRLEELRGLSREEKERRKAELRQERKWERQEQKRERREDQMD